MAPATRRAAVLGHPIDHSLSPVLHRAAYEHFGLDWEYSAVDVTAGRLADFLGGLGPEWAGLSLTMPLKETVIDLLTDVEPVAAFVRAVNTVILDGPRRTGFNTDISGLKTIFDDVGVDSASTVTLVGAGATARSTVAALAATGVQSVLIVARRPSAAAELVEVAEALGLAAEPGRWPATTADLASNLVVSTVPAEVGSTFETPDSPGTLVDVLYHPWPTPLAAAWKLAGGPVVGGLELLVRQAVEQVALMTGHRPPLEVLRAAGAAALDLR